MKKNPLNSPKSRNPKSVQPKSLSAQIVGVICGLIIGVIVVSIIEKLGHVIYPPAGEIDFAEPDSLARFIESLPLGAFFFVLAAHGLGSFAGAFAIFLFVKQKWWTGPIIIGAILGVAGAINLVLLPHPKWFMAIDMLLYLPMAILGGWCGMATIARPAELTLAEKDIG